MVKTILVKPLDGQEPGTERDFSADDFKRLEGYGAVRRAEVKKAPDVQNKNAPLIANKAQRISTDKAS